MTATALIADDEEAPRAQLQLALQQAWPGLRIVAAAVNGADAWDAFLEHEPQVCFLDVRMPGLSGIEVAQRIAGRAHVVFVTAHGDHALAAFDTGAVDYVLKPVDAPRLQQAVQRVKSRLATAPVDLQALLQQLGVSARRPPAAEVIQAAVGREVKLIRVQDVIYFESDARYTRVVHAEGEALIRTPLKELLTQLDATQFWQVHRSVIVNHLHIASALRIDENNMQLTLRGRPEKLPVSRHFQGLFKGQ
ncbi:LytR/AlgR family response regulator transcription factor [Ideonella sp. BN130291]|uniref:LytR/AlgR family response regulator transcription factor n=1 Tax=Ideonella sp. BN130291 TaxID=3112940 RepID=UPI002E2619E5|nr:LytTR family DNA-binding domain-containing protein [Ideonella sp. BN130291]